jgi:Ni2+-binding GTPase involved in maturation of urease and hydrogenase
MASPTSLHLVGGFLGSGKTTAIIQAAKLLMAQGKKVGVVTNDQGKYLVDTAFFRFSQISTVEVTGGCFCCNYDDLAARLDQLQTEIQPDVIFAESVGSCGDLVATVIKPLLALRGSQTPPTSFTVFTDSRLLQLHLSGEGLPFSDPVVYLFDQQIQEAGILILNKSDLLEPDAAKRLRLLARERFPDKVIRMQDSTNSEDIQGWVSLIQNGQLPLPQTSLEMDYLRYGEGEAKLAWLDEEISMEVPDGLGREVAQRLIAAILSAIRIQPAVIGHVKFMVQGGEVEAKVSLPTLDEGDWHGQVPVIPGTHIAFLVNARVEMPAEQLAERVHWALAQVSTEMPIVLHESRSNYFHLQFPNPTHRYN